MGHIVIQIEEENTMIRFAAVRISAELEKKGCFVRIVHLDVSKSISDNECNHIIIATKERISKLTLGEEFKGCESEVEFRDEESYSISLSRNTANGQRNRVVVTGSDEKGAMYGGLDLAEQLYLGKELSAVEEKCVSPSSKVRAIKFNLPLEETILVSRQDVEGNQWFFSKDYWIRFLDMMAENRYNTLTLWSAHPFPLMVKLDKYPEASDLSQEELETNIQFFRQLFRMTKDRGIDTHIIPWNIHLPRCFAKTHGLLPYGDDSPLVRDYVKECVKATLQTYPDLTGIGTCPGEEMLNMTSEEREEWIRDTYIAGITESGRTPLPAFWHRFHGAEPGPLERVLASEYPGVTLVTIKYNDEHFLSLPDSHFVDSKWLTQEPKHYQIVWHLRNDDVFILRWGDPHFVKKLLGNCQRNSVGYVVGSEVDIPGPDVLHSGKAKFHQHWQYKFEKQWFFWMLMGRLGYQNDLPESLWKDHFCRRFGVSAGDILYQAMLHVSKVVPLISCIHWGQFNGCWYPEGNIGKWNYPIPWGRGRRYQGKSKFHGILQYMFCHTISNEWQNIVEYANAQLQNRTVPEDITTPPDVARQLREIGKTTLQLLQNRHKETDIDREAKCMCMDAEAWANLSMYYSNKILAAIELMLFIATSKESHRENAMEYLKPALRFWKRLSMITSSHYKPCDLYIHGKFSWDQYTKDAEHDIYLAENIEPDPEGVEKAGLIGKFDFLPVRFDFQAAVSRLKLGILN